MPDTHVVLRYFEGDNKQVFEPHERVDASLWRNAAKLVDTRYMRPLLPHEVETGAKKKGATDATTNNAG